MAKSDERTVIKKVKNAILFSDGVIRLDSVRASYPHLVKPFIGKDGKEGKYGLIALLPKSSHTEAKNLLKEIILDMLDKNDAQIPTARWFLSDGDQTGKREDRGQFRVSAHESRRPTCRDRHGNVLELAQTDELFYGGCYVNILIRPWYQDGVKVGAGWGKRINAGLVGVQFLRDGEAFGEGRVDDEGIFGDVSGEEDEVFAVEDDDL